MFDRRTGLKLTVFAAAFPKAVLAQGSAATSSLDPHGAMRWAKGFEGQRKADNGDGTFLNPIFAGDHPDPSLLCDGEDYYLTFSSFDAYPGITIWHSRDLVNWRPLTAALAHPIGSVWAPDLVKHDGRYFCYIPARTATKRSIYVVTAKQIGGPWSTPVDLNLPAHIDPAHVTDEKGRRWLFLSGGDRIRLSDDGLRTEDEVEHVYDPWRYPEDWVVETFAPEGPKIVKRDGWWYMTTAVGGTAGPPTGHMVIMARSRSIDGPWENCPRNPIIRTRSVMEKWWSRGHATLFEGPDSKWWMMYHGYENGYWTLGRQTLLEPVEWGDDGWPVPKGGDLSSAIKKPVEIGSQPHGMPLSDDFSSDRMGTLWAFYDPAADEAARISRANNTLHMRAKGKSPSDCSPFCCIAGDQAYQVTIDIDIDSGAEGGLLLYYNRRLYAGLGINAGGLMMHRYGLQRPRGAIPGQREIAAKATSQLSIRLTNERNILTIHTSNDGRQSWRKFDVQMEVSGYHHNVAYDFLSLRPALYAAGEGEVRFRNFTYQALP